MAQAHAHRFGQIIGDVLEAAIRPILQQVATERGMYLDAKGERVVRGKKRKVAWVDAKGNTHDLDYVLEAGGTPESIGVPRAFIEIAWRRYTKHSRNKAQEIQAAILPLAQRYSDHHPFLGVVLAGVFTSGSIAQLRSNRFNVLHFPYDSVIAAFATVGIDAAFDEATPDSVLLKKVKACDKLKTGQRDRIASHLREAHQADIEAFTKALTVTLTRVIEFVYVLPLHGAVRKWKDVDAAIAFIDSHDESSADITFVRYEIGIRYGNGDEVRAQFQNKLSATDFLRSFRA